MLQCSPQKLLGGGGGGGGGCGRDRRVGADCKTKKGTRKKAKRRLHKKDEKHKDRTFHFPHTINHYTTGNQSM